MSRELNSMALDDEQYPKTGGNLSGPAGYCYDLYEEFKSSSYRQDKLDEIAEGRDVLSRNLPEKTFPWPGCSNKTMGLAGIAVDALAPRLYNQIIGEDEFIGAEPVGEEDAEKAPYVEKFAKWMLINSMQFGKKLKPLMDDLLKDGTVDIVQVWDEKTSIAKIREPYEVFVGPDGNEISAEILQVLQTQNAPMFQAMLASGDVKHVIREKTRENEYEEYRVRYEIVNLWDAYFPDSYEKWDEQPYIRVIRPTLYELEDLSDENGGPYISSAIDSELVVDPERQSDENADRTQSEIGIKFSEYTREVKLLEFYVKWKNEWRIMTFAPDVDWRMVRNQRIIDVYPFAKKPMKRLRIYGDTKQSMGTGVPARVKHYDRGIDDLFNIWIDAWTREVVKPGFIEDVPGLSDIDTEWSLEKILVKVPPKARITFPPESRSVFQAAGAFIEFLLAFFEKDISLMDHTLAGGMNRAGKGTETATGMSMILQEGNIKHQYQGDSLRDQFEELFTDTLSIYAYMLPMDLKIRIFESGKWIFEPVDIAALQGRWDLRLNISDSTSNKMIRRKDADEKLSKLAGAPGVNVPKLVEDYLKAYGHRDASQYISPNFEKAAQILGEAPDAYQALQQFMQQRSQQQEMAEAKQQAEKNIMRQNVQRDVELASGQEDKKIVDQVSESTKREMYKPAVEQATVRQMMTGTR